MCQFCTKPNLYLKKLLLVGMMSFVICSIINVMPGNVGNIFDTWTRTKYLQ
jgi:hypothetical protein